jgi:hypothetical protein
MDLLGCCNVGLRLSAAEEGSMAGTMLLSSFYSAAKEQIGRCSSG